MDYSIKHLYVDFYIPDMGFCVYIFCPKKNNNFRQNNSKSKIVILTISSH